MEIKTKYNLGDYIPLLNGKVGKICRIKILYTKNKTHISYGISDSWFSFYENQIKKPTKFQALQIAALKKNMFVQKEGREYVITNNNAQYGVTTAHCQTIDEAMAELRNM